MIGVLIKGAVITGLIVAFLTLTPTISLGFDIYVYKDFLYNLFDKIGYFAPLSSIFSMFAIYISIKWLFIRFGLLEKLYNMIKS